MGLTIHYNYSSKKKISNKRAEAIVRQLNDHAKKLVTNGSLAEASEVYYLSAEDFTGDGRFDDSDPMAWAKSFADAGLITKTKPTKNWRGEMQENFTHNRVKPIEGWLFRAWPGSGSEECNFGLFKYPAYIEVPDPYHIHGKKDIAKLKTNFGQWHWSSFTKTIYATNYGKVHFLKCHIAVCDMLDMVASIPELNLEVHDEGDFWDNRDIVELANEGFTWNKMLASMAGMLMDGLAGTGIKLEAEIVNHPDFEVLETEGRAELESRNVNLDKVLEVVTRIADIEYDESMFMAVNTVDDLRKWIGFSAEIVDDLRLEKKPDAIRLYNYIMKYLNGKDITTLDEETILKGLRLVYAFQQIITPRIIKSL